MSKINDVIIRLNLCVMFRESNFSVTDHTNIFELSLTFFIDKDILFSIRSSSK